MVRVSWYLVKKALISAKLKSILNKKWVKKDKHIFEGSEMEGIKMEGISFQVKTLGWWKCDVIDCDFGGGG